MINSQIKRQSGTVLIMALLLLFVMTLVGVSTMTTSTMEERMAGNLRDRHISLASTESAIVDAEQYIVANYAASIAAFGGLPGEFALGTGPTAADAFTGGWWGSGGSINYSKTGGLAGLAADPEYTIEHRGTIVQPDKSNLDIPPGYYGQVPPEIESFRITARGVGVTPNSVVILQSHWGQRIN